MHAVRPPRSGQAEVGLPGPGRRRPRQGQGPAQGPHGVVPLPAALVGLGQVDVGPVIVLPQVEWDTAGNLHLLWFWEKPSWHRWAFGLSSDGDVVETANEAAIEFGDLLVSDFDGAHWPLWPLLRATIRRSRRVTVLLKNPRDEARGCGLRRHGLWQRDGLGAEHRAVRCCGIFLRGRCRRRARLGSLRRCDRCEAIKGIVIKLQGISTFIGVGPNSANGIVSESDG